MDVLLAGISVTIHSNSLTLLAGTEFDIWTKVVRFECVMHRVCSALIRKYMKNFVRALLTPRSPAAIYTGNQTVTGKLSKDLYRAGRKLQCISTYTEFLWNGIVSTLAAGDPIYSIRRTGVNEYSDSYG
eukprot:gb/GECG01014715.1/.p1 GENE.gb/GECG01014715.1/~~gb/GECG01014715.1/.p1  ORF type:complete len:129 (+),score=9.24 gb/GECG01014715.1/:1-387(+)